MPGEAYTLAELTEMSPEDLAAARANGFLKPDPGIYGAPPATHERGEVYIGTSVPKSKPQPRDDVWASKSADAAEYEFVCPSGQNCAMRKLSPERLLEAGILDKVTRLEGLADTLIKQAEGLPPEKQKLPSREDLAALLEVINLLIPIAVVAPKVWADDASELDDGHPDGMPAGGIRCSDIDLEDRMAIMNEALKGIRKLDPFRLA
jgi:hypothetical protein